MWRITNPYIHSCWIANPAEQENPAEQQKLKVRKNQRRERLKGVGALVRYGKYSDSVTLQRL